MTRRFSQNNKIPHTFVSSYYTISNQDIREFLQRCNLEFKESSNGYIAKTCPICPKPHNDDRTNFFTLGFKYNSGIFNCFRCGASGS
mmetsp:Transcript_35564/g.6405  ORF Transcript_35564/g.6405 Transcript_35564/m.6405 type:complete len:87 (+) Transcript_35564:32-292(+)